MDRLQRNIVAAIEEQQFLNQVVLGIIEIEKKIIQTQAMIDHCSPETRGLLEFTLSGYRKELERARTMHQQAQRKITKLLKEAMSHTD